MTKKIKIIFVLSLITNLVLTILLVVQSRSGVEYQQSFLNPRLDIRASALAGDGFKHDAQTNLYIKTEGDTISLYNPLAKGSDLIFTGYTEVRGLTDSTRVVEWIRQNDGMVYSEWESKGKSRKFFVKGLTSGLISHCEITPRAFYIYYDYPLPGISKQKLQGLRSY